MFRCHKAARSAEKRGGKGREAWSWKKGGGRGKTLSRPDRREKGVHWLRQKKEGGFLAGEEDLGNPQRGLYL